MIRPIIKSLLFVLGALWVPLALAESEFHEGCEPFTKEVSVDGGLTWFDADTVDDAPVVELGTEVQYRFILRNCFKQDEYGNWFGKKCWDTTVSDATLFGLDELGEEIRIDVEDGTKNVIEPGQKVTITYDQTEVIDGRNKWTVLHDAESPFQSLLQPDRCDTPGDKLNTATEWTTAGFYRIPEDPMSDDAWVRCEGDEPVPASLGDRVWEDLNRDGVQNCIDGGAGDELFPADGILGNEGDSGDECGAGIPSVAVDLFEGDCVTPVSSTVTDANGFYLFENLDAGDYCVGFVKPGNEFCDTDGLALGMPQFTAVNVGDADADSDADVATGLTAPVTLAAGDNDLTIDAGIYCPAKIGDYVFIDNNEDGVQDEGDDPLAGVEVALWDCGPDMVAGTDDDVMTEETRTTDESGMYMFGAEDAFTLEPGKYFVQFDAATLPAGYSFTTLGAGVDDALDSDCMPDSGMTACTDLTASRAINLARDCGVVPPPVVECNLTLDKFCSVVPAPAATFEKCSGKLEEFTLVWNGAGTITAAGPNNTVTVSNGQEATFFGPFSNNDVEVAITGDVTGTSVFHVSCSDDDFNDPTDCGKMAGDGKDNDSSMINDWLLEGFVDADGTVMDCTPDGGEEFAENCTFEQPELPNCDNGEKPVNMTWRYDGGTGGDGDCADSTFYTIVDADGKAHSDFQCTGSINTADTITVTDDGGNTYTVAPGESFTTLRDDIGAMTLTDASGNTQDLVFHTSCSQPLEATATAGAITLTALDDRTGGQDVIYRYDVTNLGDELTNVTVDDDQLGIVLSGLTMANGDFTSVDVVATLFGTTVNTAQASGTLADGSVCAPTSAFDTVTVEAVVPPCSVSVALDKVEEDKLKIKLTNNDTRDRTVTMDTLTVSYPGARGLIETVKLNGDAYKYNDSDAPVIDNPATIGPDDWTATDVSKRQIKVGETKTLEIQTFDKGTKDDYFEVTVDFGEGCVLVIIVENQAIVE